MGWLVCDDHDESSSREVRRISESFDLPGFYCRIGDYAHIAFLSSTYFLTSNFAVRTPICRSRRSFSVCLFSLY